MEQFVMLVVFVVISLLVGKLGSKRKIGFGWAFALSLLLSPLIGLIITLISKKDDVELVDVEKNQNN